MGKQTLEFYEKRHQWKTSPGILWEKASDMCALEFYEKRHTRRKTWKKGKVVRQKVEVKGPKEAQNIIREFCVSAGGVGASSPLWHLSFQPSDLWCFLFQKSLPLNRNSVLLLILHRCALYNSPGHHHRHMIRTNLWARVVRSDKMSLFRIICFPKEMCVLYASRRKWLNSQKYICVWQNMYM